VNGMAAKFAIQQFNISGSLALFANPKSGLLMILWAAAISPWTAIISAIFL
jgi:hypothetical protein